MHGTAGRGQQSRRIRLSVMAMTRRGGEEGMKGEPLFRGMRDACFYRDFRLLEGGRVFIPQHTDRQYALGANFHQIIDFNDLPTSLFACNVHQSVFEEKNGKGDLYGFLLLFNL
ncbi:UNVERIFIED_CONTAM: hypothetical protein FKN15_006906 [Acipenser sinensis]